MILVQNNGTPSKLRELRNNEQEYFHLKANTVFTVAIFAVTFPFI